MTPDDGQLKKTTVRFLVQVRRVENWEPLQGPTTRKEAQALVKKLVHVIGWKRSAVRILRVETTIAMEQLQYKRRPTHQDRCPECGQRVGFKLRPDDVRDIVRRLEARESMTAIAHRYGVVLQVISRIKHGRIWQHVTGFKKT